MKLIIFKRNRNIYLLITFLIIIITFEIINHINYERFYKKFSDYNIKGYIQEVAINVKGFPTITVNGKAFYLYIMEVNLEIIFTRVIL